MTLPNIKAYSIVTVTKMVLCGQRDRTTGQWNRIENAHVDPYKYTSFCQRSKTNLMEEQWYWSDYTSVDKKRKRKI